MSMNSKTPSETEVFINDDQECDGDFNRDIVDQKVESFCSVTS